MYWGEIRGDHRTARLGQPSATVRVTKPRVVGVILALHAAFLLTIALESQGVEIPIVRPVTAFLYLTVVPGFLLLRLAGIDTRSRAESLAYVVGLSFVSLMFIGLAINFGLEAAGVARPLSELPVVLAISVVTTLLLGLYAWRVTEDATLPVRYEQLFSPLVLALALLPFLAIYGGLVLTRFGDNRLLLALYAIIALLPFLVVAGRIPRWLFAYTVWIVAVSLLLQNTLTGLFLAWGDQTNEASLALYVLQQGVWNPAAAPSHGNQFTMLRIVILHPIYALFTDLNLVWVFKLVHPLLFSVMPVALYKAYERFVDGKTAFLSVYFLMALFSFYLVLSRNTRTASALLFLALLLLVVSADHLRGTQRKVLAMVFVGGIVVSHYGVSYMVMVAIALAVPLTAIVEALGDRDRDRKVTSVAFLALYLTMLFGWYIYASPGAKTFGLLVRFGDNFLTQLLGEFLIDPSNASATTRYLTGDFASFTLEVLRWYNVFIGLVVVVGLGFAVWRYARASDSVPFSAEYLVYATLFVGLLVFTFLPVERFNTARTYATTMLFFAPFFVLGLRAVLTGGGWAGPGAARIANYAATGLIVGFFLLNVGFVSATVTQEYAPNALVEKDRIMTDGNALEKEYFYKQYPTVQGVASTAWLTANGVNGSTVYEGFWPGNRRGAVGYVGPADDPAERPIFETVQLDAELVSAPLGPGYVYLNAYSDERVGGITKFPGDHFEYNWAPTETVKDSWSEKNRVYDNGASSVYW